MDIDTCAVELD